MIEPRNFYLALSQAPSRSHRVQISLEEIVSGACLGFSSRPREDIVARNTPDIQASRVPEASSYDRCRAVSESGQVYANRVNDSGYSISTPDKTSRFRPCSSARATQYIHLPEAFKFGGDEHLPMPYTTEPQTTSVPVTT